MKKRPILFIAIILTLIIELILIFLVFIKVGEERLPFQLVRVFVQLFFIYLVIVNKSNTGLFLLAAYHIVTGLFGIYSSGFEVLLVQILTAYHFVIGLVIYFHDWIESKIGIKT